LEQLREWDPKWAETCAKMSMNPWVNGVLPRKTIELISVGLNAACTNPKRGRDTPPYPRGARSRRDPRRNPFGAERGQSDVDPFVQPGRAHSPREAKATGAQLQKRTKGPTPAK